MTVALTSDEKPDWAEAEQLVKRGQDLVNELEGIFKTFDDLGIVSPPDMDDINGALYDADREIDGALESYFSVRPRR